MESEESKPKSRKKFKKTFVRLVVFVVLMGAITACIFLFMKYREAVDTNPKNIEQKTIESVSKIVEVPDEKPSVVTVLDASKLSNPELAARAKDGDRLLVYANNRRVIMYRPSNGKIIDILTIKDTSAQPEQSEGIAPVDQAKNDDSTH